MSTPPRRRQASASSISAETASAVQARAMRSDLSLDSPSGMAAASANHTAAWSRHRVELITVSISSR